MYMVLEERKAEWALDKERDGMTCITNQFFWAFKKKKKKRLMILLVAWLTAGPFGLSLLLLKTENRKLKTENTVAK